MSPFHRFLRRFRKPAMIGTPPSARRIPEDPLIHARQYAHEYADRLEHFVEGRMHAFDLPDRQIGFADKSRGLPWAVFHPNAATGGNVVGERIVVNSGVLNPELLTERYTGQRWGRYGRKAGSVIESMP